MNMKQTVHRGGILECNASITAHGSLDLNGRCHLHLQAFEMKATESFKSFKILGMQCNITPQMTRILIYTVVKTSELTTVKHNLQC